jgi:surfactin synthase thioesterase subunit
MITLRTSGSATKLFCIPGGGTSAVLFMRWAKQLDPAIRLCFLELPGRGLRMKESKINDYGLLADDLYDQMLSKNQDEADYALLGYCAGAILGYSIFGRIKESGIKGPCHFFVAASDSPRTVSNGGNIFANPRYRAEIKDFMARFFPPNAFVSLAQAQEFFDRFVDIAYACGGNLASIDPGSFFTGLDCEAMGLEQRKSTMSEAIGMYERFIDDLDIFTKFKCSEPRLMTDCDITVFGGTQDTFITPENLRDWAAFTTGICNMHIIEGRHRFLLSEYDGVLAVINNTLAPQMGQGRQERH